MNRFNGLQFDSTCYDPSALQAVRDATHDVLVHSGNKAYADMLAVHVSLQSAIRSTLICLWRDIAVLPQVPDTSLPPPMLPDAHIHLSQPSFAAAFTIPRPDKSKYPNVRFWTRDDFNRQMQKDKEMSALAEKGGCRKYRVPRAENASSLFLEDENGEMIDGQELIQTRALARQIFQHLHSQGVAPKTWMKANIAAQQFYRQMRGCDGDSWFIRAAIYPRDILSRWEARTMSEKGRHGIRQRRGQQAQAPGSKTRLPCIRSKPCKSVWNVITVIHSGATIIFVSFHSFLPS